MPQVIQKFKIFLASPSDVNDERLAMSEVINELNLTYGTRAGVTMELVKWETHAAPGIINKLEVSQSITIELLKNVC